MLFSSNVFLFLFLPSVLALYYLAPRRARNPLLLAASLLFYGWGGLRGLELMLFSVAANYGFGLWIDRVRERPAAARRVLALTVAANLAPLAYFKYAGFCAESLAALVEPLGLLLPRPPTIELPIGISFFTFQAMSYVIDVYRREARVARNPLDVALYVSLFPQLIAGPIVRYRDVADQITRRRETTESFAEGIERFIVGLSKKVLIANSVAAVADAVFDVPDGGLTCGVAWLGLVCYSLQIYYDFSGYSDMAVGLGLMFGFRFIENFRYPYVARSVTEFWRRWHVSLSEWFRDYVYIPLGGNRGGARRTYRNLLVVFFLCGLWHGASWGFVVWGLYHGAFLVFERLGATARLSRRPVLSHAYCLAVVMAGWVLFRCIDLSHAATFFAALAGFTASDAGREFHVGLYLDFGLSSVLCVGVVGATPWLPALRRRLAEFRDARPHDRGLGLPIESAFTVGRVTALAGLFSIVAVVLSAATYNPFIYFRF